MKNVPNFLVLMAFMFLLASCSCYSVKYLADKAPYNKIPVSSYPPPTKVIGWISQRGKDLDSLTGKNYLKHLISTHEVLQKTPESKGRYSSAIVLEISYSKDSLKKMFRKYNGTKSFRKARLITFIKNLKVITYNDYGPLEDMKVDNMNMWGGYEDWDENIKDEKRYIYLSLEAHHRLYFATIERARMRDPNAKIMLVFEIGYEYLLTKHPFFIFRRDYHLIPLGDGLTYEFVVDY